MTQSRYFPIHCSNIPKPRRLTLLALNISTLLGLLHERAQGTLRVTRTITGATADKAQLERKTQQCNTSSACSFDTECDFGT